MSVSCHRANSLTVRAGLPLASPAKPAAPRARLSDPILIGRKGSGRGSRCRLDSGDCFSNDSAALHAEELVQFGGPCAD